MAKSVGRTIPLSTSALRPEASSEIAQWGGPSLVRGKRVLDVGTGDGRLALGCASLARLVVGVDPDPVAIGSAREKARERRLRNVTFRLGAAQRLAFPSGRFDLVILSWTL